MMITDSVFSAVSPYFWLGDVFSKNSIMMDLYLASTTAFYIANTFFACLLLFVIHNFGIDGKFGTSSTGDPS